MTKTPTIAATAISPEKMRQYVRRLSQPGQRRMGNPREVPENYRQSLQIRLLAATIFERDGEVEYPYMFMYENNGAT